MFGLACILTAILMWGSVKVEAWRKDQLTCEQVDTYLTRFRDCLANRPTCSVGGPEAFTKFHAYKEYAKEYCPNGR